MELLLMNELADDDDALLLFLQQNVPVVINHEPPFHHKYNGFELDYFTEEECENNFRFRKGDIPRLFAALLLPEELHSRSRTKWSGMEGLCVVLRRLAYPNRLKDIVPIFGRSETEISMIFNDTLQWLYARHGHLLESFDLQWLSPDKLLQYTEAVEEKGAPLPNCWGFIDGTLRPMCRPKENQQEVYSGHKRCHGLKFQSIVAPNGLTAHLFGPFEGRRHDSAMLAESNVLPTLDNMVDPNGRHLCIYGDPAYPLRACLMAPYRGNLSAEEAQFNFQMSRVRQTVEWSFGKVVSLFAFLDFKKNLKLYLSPIGKCYIVGTMLANCHTCLYGSEVSQYFEINPPSLEEYILNS